MSFMYNPYPFDDPRAINRPVLEAKTKAAENTALEKRIAELKEKLKFESKEKAETEIANLTQKANQIIKNYEIAITLIVMAVREQIEENDIQPILERALLGNKKGTLIALDKAYKLVNAGAIDSILGEDNGKM